MSEHHAKESFPRGDTQLLLTLDRVSTFVEAVGENLADLPHEERRELTEGLAADLAELVDEHGEDALGDPAEYARELRVAAGIGAPLSRGAGRRAHRWGVGASLDATRSAWDRLVVAAPGDGVGLLRALQPMWWLLRAWVAACLVVGFLWSISDIAIVPAPEDNRWLGGVILLAAIVGSVQVGRRRWWPRGRRPVARLGLVALNALAIALLPTFLQEGGLTRNKAVQMYVAEGQPTAEGALLVSNGRTVRNIHPYDAAGNPLVGVQLLDDEGRRLSVSRRHSAEEAGGSVLRLLPWSGVAGAQYNVFPLVEQPLDPATGRVLAEPRLPAPPFTTIPEVEREDIQPSVLDVAPR